MLDVEFGVLLGTIALGFVHGVEPGYGWPGAASYALDQTNKWLYGFAVSFVLGVGHLISSIAMVFAFFWVKEYFDLTQVNDPLTVGGIQIGGPVSVIAGILLILLGSISTATPTRTTTAIHTTIMVTTITTVTTTNMEINLAPIRTTIVGTTTITTETAYSAR